MHQTIISFYDYQNWAMRQLFTALKQLSPDEYNAPGCSGHGSIRQTLAHLLQTQKGWFSWFDGSLPPAEAYALKFTAADVPTVEDAERHWEIIHTQTRACLETLNDEKLAEVWSWSMPNGSTGSLPLGPMIFHVANHGTHTRAQIVSALRRLGHTPGVYEYLWYVLSQQQR